MCVRERQGGNEIINTWRLRLVVSESTPHGGPTQGDQGDLGSAWLRRGTGRPTLLDPGQCGSIESDLTHNRKGGVPVDVKLRQRGMVEVPGTGTEQDRTGTRNFLAVKF